MNRRIAMARGSRHWIAAALGGLAVLAGCDNASRSGAPRGPATRNDSQGGLFESVAGNLDHLEEFETEQILKQTCDRLNQWYLQEKPQVAWERDPLVDQLDSQLRDEADHSLERTRFQHPDDAWFLQEAVWLRDISSVARADQFRDLDVAKRLFDWTVRNIQLEDDPAGHVGPGGRRWPYETLLFGRGTAMDRAWLFILLARQQGLDVVLLGLADDDGKSVRPWLPALVLDDELYLFDCNLGLPLPGAREGSVATLAEVVGDEALLRKLDLDEAHRYPVQGDDLRHVVAYVEGSPAGLSRRMALVESRLAGKNKVRLTSPGNALAQRVAKLPHIAEVRLWPFPFEVSRWKANRSAAQKSAAARKMLLYQAIPQLRLGRALSFKGQYDGEQGAKQYYLNARPPETFIENYKLSKKAAEQVPQAAIARLEAAHILMLREGKQNASFWLGLIFFDQEDYPNAIDYFAKRTLAASENGPWTAAATYNLARSYEATGKLAEAVELYEADTESPQRHGNRLRARWLKQKQSAQDEDSSDGE